MKWVAAILAAVVVVPFALVLSVLLVAWRAWWLYPAWAWYVVPLGVRQVSFWHFAALLFLAGTLTQHVETKKDDRPNDKSSLITVVLLPVFAWVMLRWMR